MKTEKEIRERLKILSEEPEMSITDFAVAELEWVLCDSNKENANSGYPLLADGWRDAGEELPEFNKKIIVYYQKYKNQSADYYIAQFMEDDDGILLVFENEHCGEENFDGIYWKVIAPPNVS